MGLFGKKKEEFEEIITDEKSEEIILKEELEVEVEKLQKEFRAKQEEIKENEQKLKSVKEEYDSTVTSLMEIKKETNQKNFHCFYRLNEGDNLYHPHFRKLVNYSNLIESSKAAVS